MTALDRRTRRAWLRAARLAANSIAAAIALLASPRHVRVRRFARPTQHATVDLPPERAAALIEATSGPATPTDAGGRRPGQVLNAALPFAGDPLHAASPFDSSGSDIDQRRALLCLTQAVYYEAGFEPVDGRRAVAQVVLNRMRHPAFPKSVCGVVYQGVGHGRLPVHLRLRRRALSRAGDGRVAGGRSDRARGPRRVTSKPAVGEATHYHADYVAPRWAPLLAKVAQIGQHIFYRWPGAWGQPAAFTGRYIGEPRDPAVDAAAGAGRGSVDDGPASAPATICGTADLRAPNDVGGLLDTSKGWTLTSRAGR